MCRFAAYLGRPRPLSSLVYDPPHALEHQAYLPREQLSGHVNVDGTGVAWWPDGHEVPLRHASELPPWSDENLRELAPHLRARAIVAAVRGTTPGMPAGRAAVAPFVTGGLAIAHNGWIGGFAGPTGAALLAALPPRWLTELGVVTDSRVLASHVAARVEAGASLTEAVRDTLAQVAAVCRDHHTIATLNLVVADGRRMVAARAAVGTPANSLYVHVDADGTVVASEPLDDGDWQPVADGHVVEVDAEGQRRLPLALARV